MERIQELVEKLVEDIYVGKLDNVSSAFLELIEEIMKYESVMNAKGKTLVMEECLVMIQDAYVKKDYVKLADILLYDLLPSLRKIA